MGDVKYTDEEIEMFRKNSLRYEELKTAESGALHWGNGWLAADETDQWDAMIDNYIEYKS